MSLHHKLTCGVNRGEDSSDEEEADGILPKCHIVKDIKGGKEACVPSMETFYDYQIIGEKGWTKVFEARVLTSAGVPLPATASSDHWCERSPLVRAFKIVTAFSASVRLRPRLSVCIYYSVAGDVAPLHPSSPFTSPRCRILFSLPSCLRSHLRSVSCLRRPNTRRIEPPTSSFCHPPFTGAAHHVSVTAKVSNDCLEEMKKIEREAMEKSKTGACSFTYRWTKSNTPLHCLAHSLNPRYYCRQWLEEVPNRVPPHRDNEICVGRNKCLRTYFPESKDRIEVTQEFVKFSSATEELGQFDSLQDRWNLKPKEWWIIKGKSYKEGESKLWDLAADEWDPSKGPVFLKLLLFLLMNQTWRMFYSMMMGMEMMRLTLLECDIDMLCSLLTC
ncbi:hypothetical protein SESBI_01833 [Sesbania bispinosa]|nr:hypothetical protein SESBI_01833 [Sesbania bispinosa]